MNKVLTALVALSVLILAAWTPVETSNNSVTRLNLGNRDFCSGVIVETHKDFVYMATAAHCAEATSEVINQKQELPNGTTRWTTKKIFHDIHVLQNRADEDGVVYLILDTKGEFVAYDPIYDVAIYKVASYNGLFVPAVLSQSEVRYGDKVYAMGMPLGLWGTITSGEVTKPRLGAVQDIPEYVPQDAIVHSAYMKPGISGGGLFNDKGELIGLTNWGLPGGPYMATRVQHVIDLLKEIKNED